MVHINGYVFRADRSKKGGVAVYTKVNVNCICRQSVSISKCFELLAIKVFLPNGSDMMVVGCYRTPSASSEAISLLTDMLHSWTNYDLVLMGDLNWDWLSPSSDSFKDICNSLCLDQLINSQTCLNGKDMSKSSLIDVILTNIPHVLQ